MDDEKINDEELNENSTPEETTVDQKTLTRLLGELATATANLGLVKASDIAKTAKETATELKSKASTYIEKASTEYDGKKAEREGIKTAYEMEIDKATSKYKENMEKYNFSRQDVELTLNDDRCELAEKLSDKKAIEEMPVYRLYKKAEASQRRVLSEAVRRGDTESIEKCNEELKRLQADFEKSPVGQQHAKTKADIEKLKKSIQEAKAFVRSSKKNEKETKRSFKALKKGLALEKSTALANVGKTSKIKALIGKISAIFKGKKSEKTPQKESFLKSKIESVKAAVSNFMGKVQDMQKESLQKAASITRNGKDKIAELGGKVKGGIQSVITTVRDSKNKRIAAMKKKVIGATEHVKEKSKAISDKRAEEPEEPESRD